MVESDSPHRLTAAVVLQVESLVKMGFSLDNEKKKTVDTVGEKQTSVPPFLF